MLLTKETIRLPLRCCTIRSTFPKILEVLISLQCTFYRNFLTVADFIINYALDRTTLNPSTIDVMVDSPSKKQKTSRYWLPSSGN